MRADLARAIGVTKRYDGVVAVRGASVDFRAGRIHAVCGENGAGKSTLLKMVAGIVAPDGGVIEVRGAPLAPSTPREAIARGVAMVLQHFALVSVFTVLENIVVGKEPTKRWGVIDWAGAREKALLAASDLGVDLQLDRLVESLGVGERQRVEIARALFRDAKLLILDEPTAVLAKGEVVALYATLRRLADAGRGVVVVTHKMDEVRSYADDVTVMRRGDLRFTRPIERGVGANVDAQIDDVARAVMGQTQAVSSALVAAADVGASRARTERGDRVMRMADVVVGRELCLANLEVCAGEIVGVAGVEGNGQREMLGALARDVVLERGEVFGDPVVIREDRQSEGLVLDATVRDNLVLGELGRFERSVGLLDLGAIEAEAARRLATSGATANVAVADLDRTARSLSGGNQQKLVVTRALAKLLQEGRRALVAAQPTRGVDLGARKEIHERLREVAAAGVGILLISSDLDELRELADRIVVLSRGRVVAEVLPSTSDEDIGRLMLGFAPTDGPDSAVRSS